jgi:hypothetical protein
MTETIQIICGLGLVLISALALIPFCFSKGWRTWSLYLPIIGTLLYLVYEALMQVGTNIRIDMLFIMPMLLFLWINGVAKAGILMAMLRKTNGETALIRAMPQRIIQMAFTLPIALGCFLWFAKMWW